MTIELGSQPSPAAGRAALAPIGRGLAAAGRGISLTGLIVAEFGVLCALSVAVTFSAVGIGLLLIPGIVLAGRVLSMTNHRLAGRWCDTNIAVPYLPPPGEDGREGLWRRYAWLLSDPATWRDLLWMLVDCAAGWVLTLAPAALLAWGSFGVIMPAVWRPIAAAGGSNWYAFIHVTGAAQAWLSVPLGVAFIAAGLWAGPPLLAAYGRLVRRLLVPASRAQLERRVQHLARTRLSAVQARAAEARRIERDLHDGAQARLVTMGMTLDAAEQVVDDNPVAARALLAEAREISVKALAELRDLVRGIHPPVLADRGLTDAVRALALDSRIRVEVTGALPARPQPPVESAAYFAVSELLANVTKHAGACQAWIDLRHDGGRLKIAVSDNGRGGADRARGSGLAGVDQRLAAFDGSLAISSPPGGPTIITLEIPCVLSSPKTCSS